MAYSYSKLGGKYLLADIEQTDVSYHRELQRMYKHLSCDCGSKHTNWATVKRGAERFVCINCAQKLRADAQNKIKSAMGTYRWHPDEMKAMRHRYSTVLGAAKTEESTDTEPGTEDQKTLKKKSKRKKKQKKKSQVIKNTSKKNTVEMTLETVSRDDPFGFFANFLE